MRKLTDLLWDLALAVIALAGGLSLIAYFFSNVQPFVFSIIFGIAFIFMFIVFIMRYYEYLHPIHRVFALIDIVNDEKEPHIIIELAVFSTDNILIEKWAPIKFKKKLNRKMKNIFKFRPSVHLSTNYKEHVIRLNNGDYFYIDGKIEIEFLNKYNIKDFDVQRDIFNSENDTYSNVMGHLYLDVLGRGKTKIKLRYLSIE